MKRLYFIRHGLSEWNVRGVYCGQSECDLTAEGKRQAKLAGQAIKELGIDHIISSPQRRAHDTAKIIAREIGYPEADIELSNLFIERGLGAGEGQTWHPDLDVDGFADVETRDNLKNRLVLGLEHLKRLPYDNILVVSHGATGRMLRHIIKPEMVFEPTERTRMPNAQVVQFV